MNATIAVVEIERQRRARYLFARIVTVAGEIVENKTRDRSQVGGHQQSPALECLHQKPPSCPRRLTTFCFLSMAHPARHGSNQCSQKQVV